VKFVIPRLAVLRQRLALEFALKTDLKLVVVDAAAPPPAEPVEIAIVLVSDRDQF
jgi:hypothetical protein